MTEELLKEWPPISFLSGYCDGLLAPTPASVGCVPGQSIGAMLGVTPKKRIIRADCSDITGREFGLMIAQRRASKSVFGTTWICLCRGCNRECLHIRADLVRGNRKTCGSWGCRRAWTAMKGAQP
jgi:hypothetical protein